ncbi:MAG TPA: hypothetical protein VFI02_13485 [Armatimonadota bacterium]|nr:hypothetical protein [Armatimonadota bacterium]
MDREGLAGQLRELGLPEDQIEELLSGRITAGRTFGHAHTVDAHSIVDQAFMHEGATKLLLEITRDAADPLEWDGHLNMEVKEVEREDPHRKGTEGTENG